MCGVIIGVLLILGVGGKDQIQNGEFQGAQIKNIEALLVCGCWGSVEICGSDRVFSGYCRKLMNEGRDHRRKSISLSAGVRNK